MTNLPKMASRTRSLLLLRETWSWMSHVSGFDPFFSAIEKVPGLQIQNVFVLQSLPPLGVAKRLARRIRRPAPVPDSPSPFVEPRHEAAGSELLAAMSAAPEALALLSAGENQYGGILSHAAPAIRSRLIVCFHQPPSWWRLHWRDANLLDGLGGIVSLCEEQRNYFVSLTLTPVTLIRHGVSLDFFTPSDRRPDGPPRLLVVGHWLRDFDTLAASVELVWQSHPQVEVECVIPPIARNAPALLRLARDSRVRWHAGISAEKLRDLYRQATLLFLPLLDASANNSIVEALACGLPIVSSKVGGITEYVPENCGTLCPAGAACEHAETVVGMLQAPDRLAHSRRACRQYAIDELDWRKSADRLCRSLWGSA